MTLFILAVAGMMVLALAFLLPVLLRRSGNAVTSSGLSESNLAVLRDQVAELERDAANGLLSSDNLAAARDDLERRVLEDGRETASPLLQQTGSSRTLAIALAIALPLLSGLAYWGLGNPSALEVAPVAAGHKVSPEQIEGMLKKLEARLVETPGDGNGWAMLARSYLVLKRYPEATAAYAKAAAIMTTDADLLADYADALAMVQGRRIEGKSLQIVEQALRIDPTQWKALAMAGSAAFERKEYVKAIGYWETLRKKPEIDADFARNVDASLAEARQLAGGKAPPAKTVVAAAPVTGAGTATAVAGSVSIAPALAAKAAPTDTVFIFARAAQGPRMPLAVLRKQVKDLPYTFSLDDSMAMAPELRLSNFPDVVIGARVSKTANAIPQSGDFQGVSQPVKTGAKNVTVIIESTVP